MTALPVHQLTDAERVNEAAHILAKGVIRYIRARRENVAQDSDFPLDFPPSKSVHHDRYHHGEI